MRSKIKNIFISEYGRITEPNPASYDQIYYTGYL